MEEKPTQASGAKKAATLSWSIAPAIGFDFAALVAIGSTKATGTSVDGLIRKVKAPASPR